MSKETESGCATDLLIDLSQPESPKLAPAPAGRDDVDDDDDFLMTIPNVCSNQIVIGANDVSYSMERHRSIDKDDADKCGKNDSDSESTPHLLDEEQFDFDVPNWAIASDGEADHNASNAKSESDVDDDEEVFFGPVGHTEKCVAVAVNEVAKVHEKSRPLSPLTAAEMAELCREACTIASRIEIAAGVSGSVTKNENIPDDNQLTDPELEINVGLTDNLTKSISAVLPSATLPSDINGVIKFSAGTIAEPKLMKPTVRQKATNSQTGSGLARPEPVKTSLNQAHLNGSGAAEISHHQTVTSADILAVPAPQDVQRAVQQQRRVTQATKRQCVISGHNDDFSDTASIASDTSESSCVTTNIGKRSLPQPKFVRSAPASKLPQIDSRQAPTVGDSSRLSSSSSQSLAAAATSDNTVSSAAPTATTPSLQRVGSLRLKEPSTRLPAPGGQKLRPPKPSVDSMSSVSVIGMSDATEKTSGLRPPAKPDLTTAAGSTLAGLDKRKTLTAIRSLNLVGPGQKQGPLKAVLPTSDFNSSTNCSVQSISKGVNLPPTATSTPCRPVRADGKLNSSLCTPSRSSIKPPVVTGSTQKRLSCVPTPGRFNSPFSTSRIGTAAGANENDPTVLRRTSTSSANQMSAVSSTPISKENVSALKRPSISGLQPKTNNQLNGSFGARRAALKLSNN